jgi:hypothetical protein
LSIRLDPTAPEGFLVYPFAAGDDPLACRDYVRERLGLAQWQPRRRIAPRPTRAPRCDREHDIRERRRAAQRLSARSLDGRGSPVATYLASRGIRLEHWPATLRFLPASPPNHLWPTMVAAYGFPTEPEPGVLAMALDDVVGVQLTYLRPDGLGKAPIEPAKRSIGRGHVAPIVLAPMNDSLGLVIAEGIEDALSVHVETGLGAWAAGGASRMPALAAVVPSHADNVTIIADDNDAGRCGARGLRERLDDRGIAAEIIFLELTK